MHLFIIFTSERGLCGAFNSSVIKQVRQEILNLENNNKKIKLIIIGKKGYEILQSKYTEYIDSYFNINAYNYDLVLSQLRYKILNFSSNDIVGNCYLFFNKFQNAVLSKVTKLQLLPFKTFPHDYCDNKYQNAAGYYEYEGSQCVANSISLYIKAQLNNALVHSNASEEGARMTAMEGATKNAHKIIGELTLKFNRARQGIITKELIEIISGAEVV